MAKITNAALLALVDGKFSLVNAELADLKRRIDALGDAPGHVNVVDVHTPTTDGYASKNEAIAAGREAARVYGYGSCKVVPLTANRWGYTLGNCAPRA